MKKCNLTMINPMISCSVSKTKTKREESQLGVISLFYLNNCIDMTYADYRKKKIVGEVMTANLFNSIVEPLSFMEYASSEEEFIYENLTEEEQAIKEEEIYPFEDETEEAIEYFYLNNGVKPLALDHPKIKQKIYN